MHRYIAAVSVAALLWNPAHALQTPPPTVKGGDPHVQVAIYNPSEETLVIGAVGRSLTITFGPNEHIRRVVLEMSSIVDGKPAPPPWQGPDPEQVAQQALGNVLPLWATRPGRSNAQVVTGTEDGANRVYQLRLIALPPQPNDCLSFDCDDPRLTTGLTFLYPGEKKKGAEQAAAQVRLAAQKLASEDRLKTDIFYGQRNWKYVAKGQPDVVKLLAPDQVSDNSQVTGFLYLGNRKAPSLYIVEADGSERQVSPAPNKDLLLVQETAAHWRLRQGLNVVDLYNEGFDPIGTNPETGTISPNVVRVTRKVPVAR
ncbi:MAG: TrbG/VirB9 family P-type conjugative transfer protein [Rhodopila sp.]